MSGLETNIPVMPGDSARRKIQSVENSEISFATNICIFSVVASKLVSFLTTIAKDYAVQENISYNDAMDYLMLATRDIHEKRG